jgi:hypothetical protein
VPEGYMVLLVPVQDTPFTLSLPEKQIERNA